MHVRYYHTIICRFSYTLSICDNLLNWFLSSSQRATSDTEVLYLPLREKKPVVRQVKVNNFQILINTSKVVPGTTIFLCQFIRGIL